MANWIQRYAHRSIAPVGFFANGDTHRSLGQRPRIIDRLIRRIDRAPKGLKGIAQGNALGMPSKLKSQALKGRHRRSGQSLPLRPFRAWDNVDPGNPGRCPGLSHRAPLGHTYQGRCPWIIDRLIRPRCPVGAHAPGAMPLAMLNLAVGQLDPTLCSSFNCTGRFFRQRRYSS